jgi:UDP-GlcNAc:undecaprenyl-phosphate GlcNAc-1-phosphate transferase
MRLDVTNAVLFAVSLIFTAGLTAAAVRICLRHGWVSHPRSGRWHTTTPAFFGGVPVFVGFLVMASFALPFSSPLTWKVVGLSGLMFLLGLGDDVFHLRPGPKLALQAAIAVLAIRCGLVYLVPENPALGAGVSLLWLVGITNAFNLLDNMDGLSAGVALIASVCLYLLSCGSAAQSYCLPACLAAGSIAGFLCFNFHPARIFMGDSGSLFLGFLLASIALQTQNQNPGSPATGLAPVMIMAIPILDMLFVSVTRRLRGQPISQGGTDHSSHRLVRLGMHEQQAVLLLYLMSGISGALALFAQRLPSRYALATAGVWLLILCLFGIRLFHQTSTHFPSSGRAGRAATCGQSPAPGFSEEGRCLMQDNPSPVTNPTVITS